MNYLEDISDRLYEALYVDLFVRPSNAIALKMYKNLGYDVYQTVIKYYSSKGSSESAEDAFDMRKSLSKDPSGELMRPTGTRIKPSDLKFH